MVEPAPSSWRPRHRRGDHATAVGAPSRAGDPGYLPWWWRSMSSPWWWRPHRRAGSTTGVRATGTSLEAYLVRGGVRPA